MPHTKTIKEIQDCTTEPPLFKCKMTFLCLSKSVPIDLKSCFWPYYTAACKVSQFSLKLASFCSQVLFIVANLQFCRAVLLTQLNTSLYSLLLLIYLN